MRLIAIAIIENTDAPKQIRILDIETGRTQDVNKLGLSERGELKEGKIENLRFETGTGIVGSNGSLDRLPKIIDGQVIGKSPLIILDQIADKGYRVSDFKGSIRSVSNEDILKYANTHGIANGKIVTKEGKQFISSINGNYNLVNRINEIAKHPNNTHLNKRFKTDCVAYKLYRGKLAKSSITMGNIELEIQVKRIKATLEKDTYEITTEVKVTPITAYQYLSGRENWYLSTINTTILARIDNSEIIDLSPKSKNNEWQEKTTVEGKMSAGLSLESAKLKPNLSSEYKEAKEISRSMQDTTIVNTVNNSREACWELQTNSKQARTSTESLKSSVVISVDKKSAYHAAISVNVAGTFTDNEKLTQNKNNKIGLHLQRKTIYTFIKIENENIECGENRSSNDIEEVNLEQILKKGGLLGTLKRGISKYI